MKSNINKKNSTSAIKNKVPGNPKNINKLMSTIKKSLGLSKLIDEISVTNLVLNLLLIQSTKKKKLVDRNA